MSSTEKKQQQRQSRIPVLEMVRQFNERNQGYFCIPGHRFERGVNPALLEQYGEGLFRYDLTETDNLDDLHHAEGPILEAQQLAAELFGSEKCFFLVNGTTCGNEAMILTAVGPGEKILVPRNAHKSVLMGLILSGAVPVWIQPDMEAEWGTAGALSPERVEEALTEQPDIRAVFLVSPTYHGICSDIEEISRVCHSHGVPLLVDEAHGSHLYFHQDFPNGAIRAGADACAQSTHKTLGSLTQTSMLHMQGELLCQERMDENLKLVMSTSPSYVLMAAIDAARQQMAVHGEVLLGDALEKAEFLKRELSGMSGYRVLERQGQDPLRVVISGDPMGISGEQLQQLLYERGSISLELADPVSIVLVITWGNTLEEISHLIRVLKEIQEEHGVLSGKTACYAEKLPFGKTVLTPREAYYRKKESIPLEEAAGRIAGELVAPYPPGIPVLCPGEEISEALIHYLKDCAGRRCVLHGPQDESLRTIRVLCEQ
ncbi:MAG: aminotransferase class V-fold PLP-dependent enzyme [Lachnospiraceae bacterium]|nr:aminotransferase class V-fold PLP-dependent enzyme [Lachnospiraceae bacterium]